MDRAVLQSKNASLVRKCIFGEETEIRIKMHKLFRIIRTDSMLKKKKRIVTKLLFIHIMYVLKINY